MINPHRLSDDRTTLKLDTSCSRCGVGGWTIGIIPLAEVSSWGSSLSEILRQNTGQYPPNIPGQSLVLGAQGVPAPWRLEGARDSRDGRWCGMSGATSKNVKKKLVNRGDGVMFHTYGFNLGPECLPLTSVCHIPLCFVFWSEWFNGLD